MSGSLRFIVLTLHHNTMFLITFSVTQAGHCAQPLQVQCQNLWSWNVNLTVTESVGGQRLPSWPVPSDRGVARGWMPGHTHRQRSPSLQIRWSRSGKENVATGSPVPLLPSSECGTAVVDTLGHLHLQTQLLTSGHNHNYTYLTKSRGTFFPWVWIQF